MQNNDLKLSCWRMSVLNWLAVILGIGLIVIYFNDGLSHMVGWWDREEYSHGPLIPILSIFFIWQVKDKLEFVRFESASVGIFILIVGLFIGLAGKVSTIHMVMQYASLVALVGLAWSLVGTKSMRFLWVPLGMLIFMIQLPQFLYINLSQKLQLISSFIGVEVIRLFGVSVFLEGNVIDLGTYKLQVVDACSGLRYLFPLMSFGFICAYLFKAPMWQRVLIFLSTIPITV